MSGRYDVIATNPPYMSARKMNSTLKRLVSDAYPAGRSDLYAAFIQRCLEFTGQRGRVGMLTMHSFMFISSYERLRSYLRQRVRIDTLAHLGPGLFAVGNPGTLQTAAYVLSREPNVQTRNDSFGTYFRLVKEPDGEAKRGRFEQALANLGAGQPDPLVYRYRQSDFDVIPDSPWVYWITPTLRELFISLPILDECGSPQVGIQTSDTERFLRLWWEVGQERIGFSCSNRQEAKETGKHWFPCMKGGAFKRWFGNQEYVINWLSDGIEIRALVPKSVVRNAASYFRRGVTYSKVSSKGFSARLSPGGFLFDDAGSSIFGGDLNLLLAVVNSSLSRYMLGLINPTLNYQVGDMARLPITNSSNHQLSTLVGQAIELAIANSNENETTYVFIEPPSWETGLHNLAQRHQRLAEIEQEIDEEVYRLYGISDEDRAAIEAELAEPTPNATSDEESENFGSDTEDAEAAEEVPLTREKLARLWISYAVGIVMGRFQPGIDGALGRGHFSEDIAAKLRALADSDGILVLDQGHPDDLPTKVLKALQLMLGQNATNEVVAEGTGRGGSQEDELRRYFERTFFKEHIQKYRKRPGYWLLQSPRKTYSVWLFHEKLTKDTLYRIRGEQYVASKIRLLESRMGDLRRQREAAQGRERRALEKQVAELNDMLDDLRAFAERIDAILQRGYTPHIDDGVLINMAPLWELMPSWQAEPKKCWEALARGDYDWSHQAMDHWPERVRKKCQTNKSYAIAHGLA